MPTLAYSAESKTNRDVQFQWEAEPGSLSYEIEVSEDPMFKSVLLKKNTSRTWLDWKADNAAAFYWHVRPVKENTPAIRFNDPVVVNIAPKGFIPQAFQDRLPASEIETRSQKKSLISLQLSVYETYGSFGDSSGIITNRAMLTSSLGAAIGLRLGSLTPQIYAEYGYSGQIPSASNVQNTNVSGQGYLLGGQLQWTHNKFSLGASILFVGQYSLSQQTTTSQSSVYSQPLSLNLTLGYEIAPNLSILATAKDTRYNSWSLGSDPVTSLSYGVGLRYEFH